MRLKGETTEESIARALKGHPIEFEPQIPTLGKPLIIEVACPGWQSKYWGPKELYRIKPPGYKEGGVRFPAIPCSIEDQVTAIVECVKAGAAAVHIHPIDPSDCQAVIDDNLLSQILDRVFAKVDAVALSHTFTWERGWPTRPGYIEGTQRLLELGKGNKYCQAACMLWPPSDSYPAEYDKIAQEAVKFMEENDVKPIHKLRGPYHVRRFQRALIDTNVLTKKPYLLGHDMGHPFGWPLDMEPWWVYDFITSIMATKARIPDSIICVFPGGRNWLPITNLAILVGVDLVRTGIEDAYWMYPHKDDLITSSVETVKKVVSIAKELGRPVATAEEARKILGLKITSKMK